MEELLYLLSILMHPDNQHIELPLILTGPSGSEAYFSAIETFITSTLGCTTWQKITLVIDGAETVAQGCLTALQQVRAQRKTKCDA
jgi:predicted Rossmann-fold nucleotide-binding protein